MQKEKFKLRHYQKTSTMEIAACIQKHLTHAAEFNKGGHSITLFQLVFDPTVSVIP